MTLLQALREQDFGSYEGKKFSERPRDLDKSWREAHLDTHNNEPGFKDVESMESMRVRVDEFIDRHLLRLLGEVQDDRTVAVVAHGIILSHLWKAILSRFYSGNVAVAPSVVGADRRLGLEYLGGWSNTGYLDLEIKHKILPATVLQSSSAVPPAGPPPGSQSPVRAARETSSTTPSESPSAKKVAASKPAAMQKDELPFAIPESAQPKLLDMSLVVKAVNSQEHLIGLKKTRGGIGSSAHDPTQKTMDSFFKKRKIG